MNKKEIVVIIPNVRSAYNVGSLFRTSEGFGVSHIYITGYSPSPIDRFGREVKEISKTALSADKIVPWTKTDSFSDVVQKLKKEDFLIVALEQTPNSISYTEKINKQKIAIVVGNEVGGLSNEELALCDLFVEIPMRGQKESFNVSVAFGIFLSRIVD